MLRWWRKRLIVLLLTPFEAAIAFAAALAGAVGLIDPSGLSNSALGHSAQELLPVWEALYFTAGSLILIALLMRSLRLEVAGLLLFIAAVVLQAAAILDFAGVQGVTSAATFIALALACAGRAWVLVSRWRHWHQLRRERER
jgi:GAF domain-containing protein